MTSSESATGRETLRFGIRYLTKRDMSHVVAIDHEASFCPWENTGFNVAMERKSVTGKIAYNLKTCQVGGFIVYEYQPKAISVLRLAVDRCWQRKGIGTALLRHATSNLDHRKRAFINIRVRDDNLVGHLFLKHCRWIAVGVNPGDCPDGTDSYSFVWAMPQVMEAIRP